MDNEEDINAKIAELDTKIQKAMQSESTLFYTDTKLLETQIEEKLENVYENTNIKEIEQYKRDITNSITKKAKIVGDLTPNGSYINQLIDQRNDYEKQLNANSKYVYADRSGIISYKVDGLENNLKVGDFSYLNKSFLESLNLKSSQIVASSETNAKIIDNFKCYITCLSKTEEALNSQEGDNIKLRLPNSEEIPAKIVYKSDQGNQEALLVFEVEKSVESLIDYRKIIFDIIWWSDSGLKVPNKAIQQDGDISYVLRNRAGYEEKVYVKVLRQNESHSIVDNYTSRELQEQGYDISVQDAKKSISIYDEVIAKK